MPVQSDKRLQQIEFAEAHGNVWQTNAAQIGLLPAAVTAIKTATTAARQAYGDALAAREASKAATVLFYKNTTTMFDLVADAIKTIRTYAESTHNIGVFALAQIPVPAAPSPTPPPSQPTDVTASIEPTGALTLTFKATSAGSGAVYLVRRKLASESNFALIGAAGPSQGGRYKTFTDTSLPANSNHIQYIIQGQRGSVAGPDSSVFVVTLGGSGPGIAAFTSATVKMAA